MKLIEYLTPESKSEYIAWMEAVKRDVIRMKREGKEAKEPTGQIRFPVFWMDMELDYLFEIRDELPEDVRAMVPFFYK